MTSRTESFPAAYTPARQFEWRRLAFTFALTLGAIFVFLASFAVGYARMNDGRVLPGVQVAGIDLAGLTPRAAEAKLRAGLPSLGTGSLTVRIVGVEETIAYSDFGREYDYEYMVAQAFGLGAGPNFVEQLREQIAILVNGASISPRMTWDNAELARRVAEVAAAAEVAPVDAAVVRENGRHVVTPASPGTQVSAEQVIAQAMAAVNNLSPASTQVAVEGEPVEPQVTTEQAQAAADRAERVVSSALPVSGADLSATIDAELIRGWVHLDPIAAGEWQLVIEQEPIRQYLATYAAQTDIPATNASFGFVGGAVEVIPSAVGRALDVEATTASVLAALQARADGQPPAGANLALVPVEPEFTTDQAEALASRVGIIGTWTTKYVPGPMNGDGVNITIPTDILDNQVVQPGARFDFLDAIGPVTSPPYESGGVIIRGQIEPLGAIGGGLCSVSTTLFNAVMRAGLQIDLRYNHTIYISRYPLGLDATVYELGRTRKTVAFTNDTGYPILIRGINERTSVTFEIWGIDDGRTTDLSDPRVENLVKGDLFLEYSDELRPGERRTKQDAYDAFESWVTRTVRDAAGNVIHENLFYSKYRKLDAIVLVGRYPGDPPAGTRIPPEQYPGAPDPSPDPEPDPEPEPEPGDALASRFSVSQLDGDTFSFSDTSTGTVESRTWDFGDGTTSGRRNPSHTYAAPGTYTVTLTVTGPGGSSSKSKTVTVEEPPPG